MTPTEYGALVVGVDGSPGSLAALRWAVAQARLLGAEVVAVHVWERTAPLRAPYAPATGCATAVDDRCRADRLLDEAVSRLLEAEPDAHIHPLLAEGATVPELLQHAHRALLLVLGHRLRDDPALPALGSVARECMRRASCPVVTVPEPETDAAGQNRPTPEWATPKRSDSVPRPHLPVPSR